MESMGKPSPIKPTLDSDKALSKRHLAVRHKLEHSGGSMESKLKQSLTFNLSHAKDHMKAYKQSKARLKKIEKKRA